MIDVPATPALRVSTESFSPGKGNEYLAKCALNWQTQADQ